MISDDVLRHTGFYRRQESASGKQNWPGLGLATLSVNGHFTNVCSWHVGTGWEWGAAPLQGNSGKYRLSCRGAGAMLFTTEG